MSVRMDDLGTRVTVAMITMNEEEAVALVIQNIKKVVPEAEIILVDSSEDKTPEIASAQGARVIRQFPPRGYGPAMECALRASTREVIITLDCDNTYPVQSIPMLARLVLDQGYDVVDASRLQKKPKAMSWSHYVGNKVFAIIASALFLRRLTDLHSGMRAYRKTMLDALNFEAQGAAFPVELLLKPLRFGYKLKTVFIDYYERMGVSKMQALDTSWWTLKRILKVRLLVPFS